MAHRWSEPVSPTPEPDFVHENENESAERGPLSSSPPFITNVSDDDSDAESLHHDHHYHHHHHHHHHDRDVSDSDDPLRDSESDSDSELGDYIGGDIELNGSPDAAVRLPVFHLDADNLQAEGDELLNPDILHEFDLDGFLREVDPDNDVFAEQQHQHENQHIPHAFHAAYHAHAPAPHPFGRHSHSRSPAAWRDREGANPFHIHIGQHHHQHPFHPGQNVSPFGAPANLPAHAAANQEAREQREQRDRIQARLQARQDARMSRAARGSRQRDELVGIDVEGGPAHGRHRTRGLAPRHSQNPTHNQPRAPPPIIDLTGDDNDENDEPAMSSQNARRRQSGNRESALRLNRSDSNYIGNQPQAIIELSSDSDDEVQQIGGPRPAAGAARFNRSPVPILNNPMADAVRARANRRNYQPTPPPPPAPAPAPAHRLAPPPQRHGPGGVIPDFLRNLPMPGFIGGLMGMANRDQDMHGGDVLLFAERFGNHIHQHRLNVDLNYAHNAFPNPPAQNHGPPKPVHEPPPQAKEGFTRDTGEDFVLICPSCDEELAYDPDVEDENGPPTKKARTRKDKAEHHFWAVKACGHVYCKRCYDNRKPSARNPVKVGFKPPPTDQRKLMCAVDGCESEVSTKTAWVGIFL